MYRLIVIFLLIAAPATLKAQSNSSDQAVVMLNKFYTAYMSAFSGSDDINRIDQNLSSLRKRYCTLNCLKQYKSLVDQTDGDPLINAQDSDKELLKSLTIRRNFKKPNLYTVSYIAVNDNNEKISINLIVTNQSGAMKIASIE